MQPRRHRSQFNAALARLQQHQQRLQVRDSSWWLAVRAGVLRRAVSHTVRPLLRIRGSSVSVGRMPLRSAIAVRHQVCGTPQRSSLFQS